MRFAPGTQIEQLKNSRWADVSSMTRTNTRADRNKTSCNLETSDVAWDYLSVANATFSETQTEPIELWMGWRL